MSDTVESALRAVAARGLPGSPPIPPLDRSTADVLVRRATQARLLGPLLDAADHGEITLPDQARVDALRAHVAAQQWCLVLEQRYLLVHRWFDQVGGLTHLVVKGPALAHLDEDDPAHRSFADLDLLVAAPHLDTAVAVLEAHGGRRRWAERRPGFDHRFAKSVTVTLPDGVEVDLHRSLCDGVHGLRIPLDRLFAAPDHFPLGGVAVPAPAPVHRLLHSAYHVILGSPTPRLMNLRDLARALACPAVDVSAVVDEARRWRGEAVLAHAVHAVATTLPTSLPAWEGWLADVSVPPAEARLVDQQRREGSKLGAGKLRAARELPWSQRPAYALALAVPSRAHLASRGLRRRDVLARAAARLRSPAR